MAGFILNFEAQLLMLEFAVDELVLPKSCPFDQVIASKIIVSFNFQGDEWIDVMPQRSDYQVYTGSVGNEFKFNGGKSVVWALPAMDLTEERCGMHCNIVVRREVAKFFEMDEHEWDVAKLSINVDDLWNNVVKELRTRRELRDCLRLHHPKDPICRSMKHTYMLKDPLTCECIDGKITIWMRLSHLGNNIITELDMPSYEDCQYFYGQEQSNKSGEYEFKELGPIDPPIAKIPFFSKVKDCVELKCCCTDDQRNAMWQAFCKKAIATATSLGTIVSCSSFGVSQCGTKMCDFPVDPKGKGKGDKGVGTGDGKTDRGTGTKKKHGGEGKGKDGGRGRRGRGSGDDDGGDDNWVPKKQRGSGPANFIPKCIPCPPCVLCCYVCEPCVPCVPCCPTTMC